MSGTIGASGPVVSLLETFSPENIYTLSFEIATYVFFLSVIIAVVASKIRIIQNTAASIENGGSWEKMLADILGYTAMLVMYFIIIYFVILSINAVTSFADSIGSLESVTGRMEKLFADAKANQEDDGWLLSLGVGITEAAGWIAFYFSLLILTITMLVMRFAQGMILGLSFIWGEIAIPMSIVSGHKPLKGWLWWLLIGAFWPFVEAVIMVFIAGAFFSSAHLIVDGGSSMAATDLYFLFTAINGLLWAAVVASPFITATLIKGDGAIAGAVMPFATAAGGIATASMNNAMKGGKMGSSLMGKGAQVIGNSKTAQLALGHIASAMGVHDAAHHMSNIRSQRDAGIGGGKGDLSKIKIGENVTDAPGTDAAQSASSSSKIKRAANMTSQMDTSPEIEEPTSDKSTASNNQGNVKRSSKQQQRRGAMINRNKNKPLKE